MTDRAPAAVAIVDYHLGNLFSVKMACAAAGLDAEITSERQAILAADAIILPGVGAYGDAMTTLVQLDLVSVLRDVAASGTPILGVCLGMQLLLSESEEFGANRGLGIIDGVVSRLDGRGPEGGRLKVPNVGWSRVQPPGQAVTWSGTPLELVAPGTFVARPVDDRVVMSITEFGAGSFCSSLRKGNVFACQFHPERSGPDGLRLYRSFAAQVAAHYSERFV